MKLPEINDAKQLETMAVLAAACLVFGLLLHVSWLSYVALGLLVTGLFVKPLAHWISVGWLAFAEVLGKGVSFVLLSVVFWVVVTPVAALSRSAGKTPAHLRPTPASGTSFYTVREHTFGPDDFEKAH
jgi:hypothetical protein